MPASMAACRTVLPFSTVTDRPSIVSVTVSITFEYSSRALTLPPDNLHQFPVVLVELDAAQDAGERHALFEDAVGQRQHHVDRFPVRVLQRHGHRHVEQLPDLLGLQDDVVALDAVTESDFGKRGAVDP